MITDRSMWRRAPASSWQSVLLILLTSALSYNLSLSDALANGRTPLPPKVEAAIQQFLDNDCAVSKKKEILDPLLGYFATYPAAMTARFSSALDGPNDQAKDKVRQSLEDRWLRLKTFREAKKKKSPSKPIEVSEADKERYIQRGLRRYVNRQKQSAAIALRASLLSEAQAVLVRKEKELTAFKVASSEEQEDAQELLRVIRESQARYQPKK